MFMSNNSPKTFPALLFFILLCKPTLYLNAQEAVVTPVWLDVYGSLWNADGGYAPAGTGVQAFDADGVLCGECTARVPGAYGFMPVYADDPYTTGVDEGASEGDFITFLIDGEPADVVGLASPRWTTSMNALRVDLAACGWAVGVTLGDHAAMPDREFILPVALSDLLGNEIYSADIRLSFDPDILEVKEVSCSGTVSQAWGDPTYDIKEDGQVWIGLAGSSALSECGVLTNVIFDVVGSIGETSELRFLEFTLNEGAPPVSAPEGSLRVGESTDVREETTVIPTVFSLRQNYPNPFNPETTIEFTLPHALPVELILYNVLGKEIAVLVDEKREAGRQRITVDGRNLESGVYIYRIRAGGHVESKRLILMK